MKAYCINHHEILQANVQTDADVLAATRNEVLFSRCGRNAHRSGQPKHRPAMSFQSSIAVSTQMGDSSQRWGFDVLLSRILHGTASTYTSSRASSCYSRDKVSKRPPAYMPLISDIAFCVQKIQSITERRGTNGCPGFRITIILPAQLALLGNALIRKRTGRFLRA